MMKIAVCLISLLLAALLTLSGSKLCYESYEDITHRRMTGEWKKDQVYKLPGEFEIDGKTTTCPVRTYTCKDRTYGHEVAHQKFFPNGCDVPELDPLPFLHSLENRRLFLYGDSVTLEFFVFLICSLHQTTENIHYNITRDVRFKQGFSHAEVTYPISNTTISYLDFSLMGKPLEHHMQHYIGHGRLFSPYDILLLNYGLHYHTAAEMLHVVKSVVEDYNSTNPFTRPILLWRDISPAHFDSEEDGAPSGYWVSMTKAPCVPYANFTKAFLQDYRNRICDHWMLKYDIPIMRINNVTGLAWDQHYGIVDLRKGFMDCGHFCEVSGVFYYWRDLLFNIVPLLLKEREEELMRWKEKYPNGWIEESAVSRKKFKIFN
jgi:hypothetical protein